MAITRRAVLKALAGAGVILMHSRGGVTDMATYAHADYGGVVEDVVAELGVRVDAARAAGVPDESIVVDPTVGQGSARVSTLTVPSPMKSSRRPGVATTMSQPVSNPSRWAP